MKIEEYCSGTWLNTSSRIEGTQTEIDEAVRPAEMIAPERRDDWQEVQNYIQAMNQSVGKLERLPLSNRLLKETHATLMQGVRGREKLGPSGNSVELV